jgi:hypothetical protein
MPDQMHTDIILEFFINTTDAVATANAFFACGRVEEIVYFRCFGGKAAKTTEKDSYFLAAAGEKAIAA